MLNDEKDTRKGSKKVHGRPNRILSCFFWLRKERFRSNLKI